MAGAERQARGEAAGAEAAERGRVGLLAALCAVAAVLVLTLLAWPPRPHRAEALLLVLPPADGATVARGALSEASLDALLAVPGVSAMLQEGPHSRLPSLVGQALDGLFGAAPDRTPESGSATARLRHRLAVAVLDGGRLVSVSAEAPEPRAALALAGGLADIVASSSGSATATPAEPPVAVLEARLAEARRKVADYRAAHDGEIGPPPLSAGQRQDLSLRLAVARAREAELRTRLDQAERISPTAPNPLDTPQLTALRHALTDLSERQNRLRGELGPRHPAVAELDAGLASAARQIDAEIARIAGLAASELDQATAAAAALAAAAQALDDVAIGRDRAERGLAGLEADVDDARRALERAAAALPSAPAVPAVGVVKRATLVDQSDGLFLPILAAVALAGLALGLLAGRLSLRHGERRSLR